MKNELRGAVIELCRVERFHNAEFVGDSSEMGKKRGKFVSTHAMFSELVGRSEELGMTSEKGKSFSLEKLLRSELAVVFLEDRFVVEKVEVRGSTGHVEKDHAASLRRDFLKALWNCCRSFFLQK
jgi:hypothetical protein